MTLSLIVAMASNRAIGIDGRMPWHLPADLRRFRQITQGHTVLMGRKTYESIGKPLPDRKNIIVSRSPTFRPKGCIVYPGINQALASREDDQIFVIGGATLYEALLPRASTLYLTTIYKEYEGDTFFPAIDPKEWERVEHEDHEYPLHFSFSKLERL